MEKRVSREELGGAEGIWGEKRRVQGREGVQRKDVKRSAEERRSERVQKNSERRRKTEENKRRGIRRCRWMMLGREVQRGIGKE